jgi:uncharacterized membrane protein YhaH (DUF805 family)
MSELRFLIRRGDQQWEVDGVEMLREIARQGRLADSDYVWHPIFGAWVYARDLAELQGVGGAPKVAGRTSPRREPWHSWSSSLRKYLEFRGRAGRKEYWLFLLLVVLAQFLMLIVVGFGAAAVASLERMSPKELVDAARLLGLLPLFLPWLAVSARRLHDRGRSGWWLLVGLIPIIGGIVLHVAFAFRGDEGENRYGPPVTTQVSG